MSERRLGQGKQELEQEGISHPQSSCSETETKRKTLVAFERVWSQPVSTGRYPTTVSPLPLMGYV